MNKMLLMVVALFIIAVNFSVNVFAEKNSKTKTNINSGDCTVLFNNNDLKGDVNLKLNCINNNDAEINIYTHTIYLTDNNYETGLFDFLESNEGHIVYLDLGLDHSLSVPVNEQLYKFCSTKINEYTDKTLNNNPLAIPFYNVREKINIEDVSVFGIYEIDPSSDCNRSLVFDVFSNTTYHSSSGGTGINVSNLKGFFELSISYPTGVKTYYHLKEIDVPFSIGNKYKNKASVIHLKDRLNRLYEFVLSLKEQNNNIKPTDIDFKDSRRWNNKEIKRTKNEIKNVEKSIIKMDQSALKYNN